MTRVVLGRGTPAHRTEADVAPNSSFALYRPDDAPGVRIIIPAAVQTMSKQGYRGTTVRDIGERAGMSSTALYHHFSSKQQLLVSIMDRIIDHLSNTCDAAVVDAGSNPADQLKARVQSHVLVNIELQQETTLATAELRSVEEPYYSQLVAKRDDFEAKLHDIVAAGQRNGVFHTKIPREVVRGILGMVSTVPTWYKSNGLLLPHEIADRYAALSLTMVEYRES